MGWVKFDNRLNDYLNRTKGKRERSFRRELNAEELEWLDKLRKRYKELNTLIAELIAIRCIIRAIREPGFFYITENLNRICFSLVKQRDFGQALRYAIMSEVPYEWEIPLIRNHITAVETRIRYLRETVIPGNLILTPVQEYLEIAGKKDLFLDIHDRFPDGYVLFDASSGKNDELEQYAMDILLTVHESGLEERYRERLRAYVEAEEARQKKQKEEKRLEKLEKDISLAKDGMYAFQRMFHKAVRTLKGCDKIKAGFQTVQRRLDEYGRDSYVVLCCYVFQSRCLYRYVGEGNTLVASFHKARIFKDGFEACEVMEKMEQAYPNKVFDVVKMDYTEELVAI